MGIAGAGKSTLASALADKLGWTFLEADSFHSAGNIERMRRGDALGAAERDPWVRRIGAAIMELEGQPCALACSALTAPVRDALRESSGRPVHWVCLEIGDELARARLERRCGHFMPASLVSSQLADLEIPANALRLDAAANLQRNLQAVIAEWALATYSATESKESKP